VDFTAGNLPEDLDVIGHLILELKRGNMDGGQTAGNLIDTA
jgi:hypothetical protein